MNKNFRRTTIISAGLTAFLLGLVAARRYGWDLENYGLFLIFPVLWLARKRTIYGLVAVALFGLACGIWRGGVIFDQVAHYQKYQQKSISLSGQVLDEPVYDDKGQLDFRIGGTKINNEELPGQVRIKARANGIRRGDYVSAQGKLSDGFGNYQASIYYANVSVLSKSASPIEKLRREFFAAIYSVLPEPQASLGLGFLAGLRSALPEDFDEQLRIAGLTHIVVASGYNLTILVRLARRFFARNSKYQAFVGSIALILGFLAITGASPSMIRAGVVTTLSLLAWYYGRRFQPILIILLGAALTAGYNPLFIWHDLGWWLSFLAFAGVLILAPLINARLWRNKTPPLLAQVSVETLSAQMLTMPLILFVFGKVSVVALLANVAVVPIIPLAMAATFLAGAAQLVLPGGFAGILAFPAHLVLSYIVSAVRLFSSPSWAQASVGIDSIGMWLSYALITIIAVILYRTSRLRFSQIPATVE